MLHHSISYLLTSPFLLQSCQVIEAGDSAVRAILEDHIGDCSVVCPAKHAARGTSTRFAHNPNPNPKSKTIRPASIWKISSFRYMSAVLPEDTYTKLSHAGSTVRWLRSNDWSPCRESTPQPRCPVLEASCMASNTKVQIVTGVI